VSHLPFMSQDLVLRAIQAHSKDPKTHTNGPPAAAAVPTEDPGPCQAFLEGFLAWNPFTAAAVAGSGHTLRHLLCLSEEEAVGLSKCIPGVTQKSARLFHTQANHGTSVQAFIGSTFL
jgi:hypothetical protein